MVLAAKSLLLFSQWMQQADEQMVREAALDNGDTPEVVWWMLHASDGLMPVTELLRICSSTVDWLGQQLTAVGLPGMELGAQQAAEAQKAAESLMAQHGTVTQLLQDAAAAAQKHGVAPEVAGSDDTATESDVSSRGARGLFSCLDSLWPALQAFASQLFDQCPVASCCCNPSCLTISSLSEWQMLNGKTCRCSGCKVARFCSKACLTQMWREHHKPVCKRLKA
jgi:hypothetical protein